MGDRHNAVGQYHHWSGGADHYDDETIERFQAIHGEDTMTIGTCEGCGRTVHTGAKGYNEQTFGYVRYGPFFICAECILDAVDLPEIPHGVRWWEDTEWYDDES